jgi:predicted dehydrogenase
MASTRKTTVPRAALIGVSGYGKIYYNILRNLHLKGELALVGATIIDPDAEREALSELRAIGCSVYADYNEMLGGLKGRIDLCAIPTGIPWHTPMTLAAIEAGANVLVEKPLAATVREVDTIRAAEKELNRTVMVGFQYLYCPENVDLKRELLAGAVGTVRRIKIIGCWPRGFDYYSRTDWAGRVKLGPLWVLDSPVSNAFAHHLNLGMFFAGSRQRSCAVPVRLTAERYRAKAIENYDTAALRVQTDSGVDVRLYATHSCKSNVEPEIEIEGDEGRVVWKHGEGYSILSKGAKKRNIALCGEDSARMLMFRAVLRRIQDPSVFVCDTSIAREHTRCVQAAQACGIISDVSKKWIGGSAATGPRRKTWIVGIEKAMRQAYKQASFLEEAACPWAGKPTTVQVADSDVTGISIPKPAPTP